MPLVILEGCDATGKTTLAEQLRDLHGYELRHLDKPTGPPIEVLAPQAAGYAPDRGERLVMDRFHWSSPVYGNLYYPDETELILTLAQFAWLEMALQARRALVVHCAGAAVETTKRARGDAYFEGDGPSVFEIERLLVEYRGVAAASPLRVWTRDLDSEDVDLIDAELVDAGAREAEVGASPVTHVVGDTESPSLLLVGESPSPNYPIEFPFLPHRSPAATFLWESLLQMDRSRLALTNALDVGGEPLPLALLWQHLGYPRVVALGRVAEDVLDEQRVPHGAVPHPHYVRRFRWTRRREYKAAIYRAALDLEEVEF